MLRKRSFSLLMIVVVLLGLLSSCTGASPQSAQALEDVAPTFESFTLRLPRIYLQYVETDQGYAEPAVFGMQASLLEAWLGLDLSIVKIPAFYVDWLKASDVQHIELVHGAEGILLYVNGLAMPYLAWDSDSMALTGDMIAGLGVPNGALLRRILPLIQHIGLDIVVQLPLADGASVIPYRDPAGGLMLSAASAEIEQAGAELKLQLDYDEEGVPSIWGLSARVLQPLLGYTPGQLAPSYMTMVDQAGVDLLTLQTQGNGLFIYVNGRPLPNVAWSDEHLANALDLYATMNSHSWVPNEAFVSMVRQVVFQVTNSDVVLSVSFP